MRLTGPGIWGEPADRDAPNLEENVAAADVHLTEDEIAILSAAKTG